MGEGEEVRIKNPEGRDGKISLEDRNGGAGWWNGMKWV